MKFNPREPFDRLFDPFDQPFASAADVGIDHLGAGPIAWVRLRATQGAKVIDIGYDSDNIGAPTIYDDEVAVLGAYPREKVPWPGSMESPPDGHHP